MRVDLSEGFGYVWRTSEVRSLAIVFVGVVLTGFTYQAIMPGFLENSLGQPASYLGVLYGATAIGGIIVTLVLAARPPENATKPMIVFGIGMAVSLALLGVSPDFMTALGVAAFVGASSSGFQMLNNISLMRASDPKYFGRVMAVTMMAFGVNSIVSYPVGLTADEIGERATLILLGASCLFVVVAGAIFSPRRT